MSPKRRADVDDVHRGPHLGHMVLAALARHREEEVLRFGGTSFTGSEVAAWSSRIAAALETSGVGPGAAVGLLAHHRPEALFVVVAGLAHGHRRTDLYPAGSLEDQAQVLADAGVTTLVADPAFADRAGQLLASVPSLGQVLTLGPAPVGTDLVATALEQPEGALEVVDLLDDHVVSVTYTAGTTGTPKGVAHTARSVAAMTQAQLAEWEWPDQPRFLQCMPLSHYGASLYAPVLIKGGTVVLVPEFEPGVVLETIERERIDSTMLLPWMVSALLDHPDVATRDLTSLEVLHYGGSSIDPARLAEAVARFGPVLSQHYGQSECPLVISQLVRRDHAGARLASCGRPSSFLRTALVAADGGPVAPGEPGEICVAGPVVAQGYWNRPDESAERFTPEGWLRTGDAARQDRDGFWYVVDRAEHVIVTGGFSVFPREVEEVIASHPAVAEAAVIGVPDDRFGEAVVAVVVPHSPSFSYDDADEVVAMVRERKGPAHTPRRVLAVPAIPLTPLGQPDKVALRRQFEGLPVARGASDLRPVVRSAPADGSRHREARPPRPPAQE